MMEGAFGDEGYTIRDLMEYPDVMADFWTDPVAGATAIENHLKAKEDGNVSSESG